MCFCFPQQEKDSFGSHGWVVQVVVSIVNEAITNNLFTHLPHSASARAVAIILPAKGWLFGKPAFPKQPRFEKDCLHDLLEGQKLRVAHA